MIASAQSVSEPELRIETVSEEPRGLRVRWSDRHESFFHSIWLRDCCYCPDCGDCYSSKRSLVPCDLPLDIRPLSANVDETGDLVVAWAPDGHRSRYGAAWLRAHCYDEASRSARRHKPILWDGGLAAHLPEATFAEVRDGDTARLTLYRQLRDYGLVILRGGPAEPGFVETVANLIGDLGDATYGKIFDLTPSGKIRTLGNTMRPVPPHTDEPFRYTPPGMMVLGCVRKADDGGDSLFVDGFALAERLRRDDPRSFDLLTGRAQSYIRRHEGTLDLRARLRMVNLDDEGAVCGVRVHTRSAAPLDLPAELVEPYYAAHHRLTAMMMAPENQVRIALQPGESALFDNHRVLHARTHFTDPERHLQICNVPREQFHERLRLLAEDLGYPEEARMVMPAGAVS